MTRGRTSQVSIRVSPWFIGNHRGMSIDQAINQDGPPAQDKRRPSRRTVFALVPLAALATTGVGVGAARLLRPPDVPATPLGALGSLDGGLARIHGIIPLETDSWKPPEPVATLKSPIASGGHRVRVLLELTASKASGVRFESTDFAVGEIVGFRAEPLWASQQSAIISLGENLQVTFIFEIPNKAIQLVLEGPGQLRLALGTAHHSNP